MREEPLLPFCQELRDKPNFRDMTMLEQTNKKTSWPLKCYEVLCYL